MSSRPDNIFQFIEIITLSNKPDSEQMPYGQHATIKHLKKEIDNCSTEIEQLSSQANIHQSELEYMRGEVARARSELETTTNALTDVTKKLETARKQRDSARTQAQKCQAKLEATLVDCMHFEDEVLSRNDQLSELVHTLQVKLATLSTSSVSLLGSSEESKYSVSFCFHTKDGGKVYTLYSLLANQMPPAKIATTIRAVLK